MKAFIVRLFNSVFKPKQPRFDTVSYWKERGEMYGEKAVLNLTNSDAEMQEITRLQKQAIFPVVEKYITSGHKTLLDFGCGPARFTADLAQLIGGKAAGVDPVPTFIDIAKKADPLNEYKVMDGFTIPYPDNTFNVLWICLVMGGIPDDKLMEVKDELLRVASGNAVLVLTENTALKKNNVHWYYRSAEFYQQLFREFSLTVEGVYEDKGEPISILGGRIK